MHRRGLYATAAVVLLALTAGCLGAGIDEAAVQEDADRGDLWDVDDEVDTAIVINEGGFLSGNSYEAVYRIDGQNEVELYVRGFARDQPLSIEALQFQFPNGTVVGVGDRDDFTVETDDGRTIVTPPSDEGKLAFSGSGQRQQLQLRSSLSGTHQVTLPDGYRVGDIILGGVSPRGPETQVTGDTMTLTWEDTDSLSVRYYHSDHQIIFWTLVGMMGVAAVGVFIYFRRKIQQIIQWRKEQGLDIDIDDDDGRRPPPGMG